MTQYIFCSFHSSVHYKAFSVITIECSLRLEYIFSQSIDFRIYKAFALLTKVNTIAGFLI